MVNRIDIYLFFLISIFSTIYPDQIFIPAEQPNLSNVPPFVSNLAKAAKDADIAKEEKAVEAIVRNVINASDRDIEKQAEELLKDKKKFDSFIGALSGKNRNSSNSKKASSASDSINFEMLEYLDDQYEIPKLKNKAISLQVKDVPIRDVVELISRSVGLDFVVDSSVSGNVENINLKNMSASFILRFLLNNNFPRLALIEKYGVLRITRLSDAVKSIKSDIDRWRWKKYESSFLVLKNANLTETLKLHIEKMWHDIVGPNAIKKGYYLVVEQNSRKIFFKGRHRHVDEFKTFLNEIDVRIPQVRIEARIVWAKKDFEESLGFNWSGIYDRKESIGNHWAWGGFSKPTASDDGTFDASKMLGWTLNFFPSSWKSALGVSLPIMFGGKDLSRRRLNLTLSAAENRNEIKTILKPSLLVNSGERAEILVGKEIPIETVITDHSVEQVRNLQTINYKELGIKLKVKPVVSPDNKKVFLDIFVENSSLDGNSFNQKTSQIMTSRSTNKVILKSGQTTLIGGLIGTEKSLSKNGIPYLQHIPLLGALFRGRRKVEEDMQLLIFITPTII